LNQPKLATCPVKNNQKTRVGILLHHSFRRNIGRANAGRIQNRLKEIGTLDPVPVQRPIIRPIPLILKAQRIPMIIAVRLARSLFNITGIMRSVVFTWLKDNNPWGSLSEPFAKNGVFAKFGPPAVLVRWTWSKPDFRGSSAT
jgi:hypothetical protein